MNGNSYEEERDVRWLNEEARNRPAVNLCLWHQIKPLQGQCLIEILPSDTRTGAIVIPEAVELIRICFLARPLVLNAARVKSRLGLFWFIATTFMVLIPIEIESLLRLMEAQCPFCNVPASRIWFDSKHSLAFLDPDKRRICLMGLSMGGFGTWSLAAAHPARFAAIVPICGGGDPADAKKLAALPIRVFHGAKDPTVPVQRSREMVEAIKAAGGNFKFTEYREAEHDCWTETYDNPELYRWLLPQKR